MSELLIGMLSYSYIQDVRSDLAQTLFESFQALYHVDAEFTQSVDLIQSKVHKTEYNIVEQIRLKRKSQFPLRFKGE